MSQHTLGSLIGADLEEKFQNFDLTEVQELLSELQSTDVIDLAHAENLQRLSLRGADILSEYMGRMIKTVGYLESQLNKVKNKVALEYKTADGKTTMDLRRFAAEASPEVEEINTKLAKAKAGKLVLDKKFDILIRSHHYYKDLASGYKKTIVGQSNINPTREKMPEGWE
jgi:hypothetical protein